MGFFNIMAFPADGGCFPPWGGAPGEGRSARRGGGEGYPASGRGRGVSRHRRGTGDGTALPCGNAPPIFSFLLVWRKEKTGRARSKREKRRGGTNLTARVKLCPSTGVFSDGARKFEGLNPSASDSVPPGGAPPQAGSTSEVVLEG